MYECRRCHTPKDETEFYTSKKYRSGRDIYCKACRSEMRHQYVYRRTPEKQAEYFARWYAKNKFKLAEKRRMKKLAVKQDVETPLDKGPESL